MNNVENARCLTRSSKPKDNDNHPSSESTYARIRLRRPSTRCSREHNDMDDERRPTRILQSFSYTQGQRDLLVSQRARRNMNYAHILRETRRADAAPHYACPRI
eukprot:jgi/Botrbrau1/17926/Bobra.50_1s0027.1